MKKRVIITAISVSLLLIVLGLILANRANAPAPQSTSTVEQAEQQKPRTGFDKTRYSTDDPASLWIVVNKKRPISLDYKPDDLVTPAVQLNSAKSAEENTLRKDAAKQLEVMFADAKKAGLNLMLASGYRSAGLQATYYNSYVNRDGQAAADRYSAKPGTSEHQTGWSLDISPIDRRCYLEECFSETPEGRWLAANASKYGFVLRYPKGLEQVTGYQFEPWHFRYVGQELAQELQKSGQTLEQFFGL